MTRYKVQWTEDLTEELLSLWRQGLSASEIAIKMGVATRNAICGKLFRLKRDRGLEQPRCVVQRRKTVNSDTVQKRIYTRREPMLTLPGSALSVSAYVSPPVAAPDEGQLASIVDVTGCKWPVTEDAAFVGGYGLCNHTRDGAGSYCTHHAALNKASYSRTLIRQTVKSVLHILKVAA